jgi:hypothetical protein
MNRPLLEQIVNAVLYEGYVLYPYRPSSVKNQQRWTFGGLFPEDCHLVEESAESCAMQTQCIVEGSEQTTLNVSVRFLHLVTRTVGEVVELADGLLQAGAAPSTPPYRVVDSLRVRDKVYQRWQEATEREVSVPPLTLGGLCQRAVRHAFEFPAGSSTELLRREEGKLAGLLIRRHEAIDGDAELSAEKTSEDTFKITVRIVNRSYLPDCQHATRQTAQLYSLASTHTILHAEQGKLVSAIDPPERFQPLQAQCRNIGSWPVLVGQAPHRDTMLASPIILYDYPQIAPESQGNLFDSTEIDEILSLRIMTLTDDEKQVVAGADERVRHLLERTDSLARDQLASLHGTLRGLKSVDGGERFP